MASDSRLISERKRFTLTRREVAARTGLSLSTVRRMEHVQLHPVEGPGGVRLFDPAEVDGLEKRKASATRARPPLDPHVRETRRQGRLAARVFRMFERGWELPQIVLATKQPPDVVRSLYHEWNTSLVEAEWRKGQE